MSKTEILAELPRLDHRDRREIARRLFEIEADAQTLADCDRRRGRALRDARRLGGRRMPRPSPGEVWRVDLGLAAKVRPCLILSDYPADDELAWSSWCPTQPPCAATVGSWTSPNRSLPPACFTCSRFSPFPCRG